MSPFYISVQTFFTNYSLKSKLFVFSVVASIAILLLVVDENAYAQELAGTWSVEFVSSDNMHSSQSWILAQATVQNVPVIQGTGTDGTDSWKISATFTGNRLSMVYAFTGENFTFALEGPIADSDHISGNWADTLGHSGTFTAVKIAGPAVAAPVIPKTVIKDPPSVIIQPNTTILILQKFSGVGTFKLSSLYSGVNTKAKNKTDFRYNVEVVRKKDAAGKNIKSDIIKKTSKKDQIALKGLKSGQYAARYNVEITSKQNGREVVVGKTKFSPTAIFTIPG